MSENKKYIYHFVLCFVLINLINIVQAQHSDCAFLINKAASQFELPDSVSIKELSSTGLYKSQLSYSDLIPLNNRKISTQESILKNNNIIRSVILNTGINESYIAHFERGVKAVVKPHIEIFESNYRTEVLAFELDQLFGFDLVPITVERFYKGRKSSVQLFKDSSVNSIIKEGEFEKQVVFDWLINSKDRHAENYLVASDGRIISIDNAQSLTGRYLEDVNHFGESLEDINSFLDTNKSKKIISNIKQLLVNPKIKTDIVSYIGEEDMLNLLERMNFLVKYASHYEKNIRLEVILKSLLKTKMADSDLSIVLQILDASSVDYTQFKNILLQVLKHKQASDRTYYLGIKLLKTLEKPFISQKKLLKDALNNRNLKDRALGQLLEIVTQMNYSSSFTQAVIAKILSSHFRKKYSLLIICDLIKRKYFDTQLSDVLLNKIVKLKNIDDKALAKVFDAFSSTQLDFEFFNFILKHDDLGDEGLASLIRLISISELPLSDKKWFFYQILKYESSKHITFGNIIQYLSNLNLSQVEIEKYISYIIFSPKSSNFSYRETLDFIINNRMKLESIGEVLKHIIINIKPDSKTFSHINDFFKYYPFEIRNKTEIKKLLDKRLDAFDS